MPAAVEPAREARDGRDVRETPKERKAGDSQNVNISSRASHAFPASPAGIHA